jgi:DNA-directed RNA polymerase specialized sigma24 family protein
VNDKGDFELFVASRSTVLLRTAYLLCAGDRAAAEDLLQDVLERMYPKWRRLKGNPEAYARVALANASANRWRTRSRRVRETPLTPRRRNPYAARRRTCWIATKWSVRSANRRLAARPAR